ncbi:MAG: metallophosphoesterase [Clostridia bacterium]|nr:metallophosphoesterase [Clostridia bacterium]
MKKDVLFGICADVHQSDARDASPRMRAFVDEANARGADFIIQLGDFILPDAAGRRLLDEWERFNGPRYHVLGNHDTEHGGKEAVMKFQGQPAKYYSFDCGDYHFIVLDTNYFKYGDDYVDYDVHNYQKDFFNCYIPPEQLDWLAADIDATDKRCFLFTHATLAVGNWVVYNMHAFEDLIWLANEKAGFNKVTMCFSGHDHADAYLFKGGVHYQIINSMSHKYIGPKYMTHSTHREQVKADYGELRHVIPYKDPLYAFVQLKANGLIRIIGKQTEYVGNSPLELHWEHYASPQISYREVWMNGHSEL